MNAHIITIGDEILIGQILNTNAAYIGSKLIELNIDIKKTSVVGDNEKQILSEFKECFNNNNLIIVTGGLGPTHDDITLKCITKFFNTELILNEDVLNDVRNIFSRRGRQVTKLNEEQALVPKIAKVIRNKLGTAPGIWIEKDNKIFVVMPGVPFEMKEMMSSYVMPNLKEKLGKPEFVTIRHVLQTTGIPESYLFERLGNIDELLNGAEMAFLPSQYGVKLRITVKDKSPETATNKLSEIEQKIRNKVGRFVFANGEETLEEVVGRLLKERELSIALAESCTGGNIANLLTNISGSSDYFERGVVSYSNGSKVEMLQVNEDVMQEFGAVSPEVAKQMSQGIRSISCTDLGLSVTGILGPTGATDGKPIGLVYISLSDNKSSIVKKFLFGEDRLLNKQRATQAALDMIRKHSLEFNRMIRLFIALKIPLHIRKEIVNFTKEFLPGFDKYKFEQIDKIHLTLKFIGDAKEEFVNEIIKRISFMNNYKKFECGLDKFDFFYRNGKPSIFFLKLQMEERINDLVIRLNKELELLNIPGEKKDFHAHLTMLRIKGYEDIVPLKKMTDKVLKTKFIADEIALYQSRLLAHGSTYKELLNYKLN